MKIRKLLYMVMAMGFMMFAKVSYADDISKAVVLEPSDVRVTAEENSVVISKLVQGQEVLIIEPNGDWVKVRLDNGIEGYISNLNIEIPQPKVATVNVLGVNLRSEATADSEPLGILNTGDQVQILSVESEWAKIEFNEIEGYVARKYLSLEEESSSVNRGSSREVTAILEMAKSLQGKPYVYGSRGPNSFDCSGFVGYVYEKAVGIKLPRVSRDQARAGKAVAMENLLPGDIVSFDTNGGRNGVNHVGIYIGDGQFIHASSAKIMRVTIDSLHSNYYSNCYMGATRIINQ